jgi:hypothetical protein
MHAFREYPPLHRDLECLAFALLKRMQLVEALDEKQVRDLLDHR